jgi:hypothetical protein
VTDGGPRPEPDGEGRGSLPPWVWIAGGIVVVMLVVAGVIIAADNGDDDTATTGSRRSTTTAVPGSSIDGAGATTNPGVDGAGATTLPGVDATSTTEVGSPAADPDDPANGPMASIPVGSVPPGPLPAVCAETVARLRIYRAVAAANGAALAGDLFTSMTEFEAEITTNAKNEEWGDFLVEKLTTVRREWSDARSAYDSGDETEANAHAAAALAELDAAIGGVNCT